MNELQQDLKNAMVPDVVVVRSRNFKSEEDRDRFIRDHPAKKHLIVTTVGGRESEPTATREGK